MRKVALTAQIERVLPLWSFYMMMMGDHHRNLVASRRMGWLQQARIGVLPGLSQFEMDVEIMMLSHHCSGPYNGIPQNELLEVEVLAVRIVVGFDIVEDFDKNDVVVERSEVRGLHELGLRDWRHWPMMLRHVGLVGQYSYD